MTEEDIKTISANHAYPYMLAVILIAIRISAIQNGSTEKYACISSADRPMSVEMAAIVAILATKFRLLENCHIRLLLTKREKKPPAL